MTISGCCLSHRRRSVGERGKQLGPRSEARSTILRGAGLDDHFCALVVDRGDLDRQIGMIRWAQEREARARGRESSSARANGAAPSRAMALHNSSAARLTTCLSERNGVRMRVTTAPTWCPRSLSISERIAPSS